MKNSPRLWALAGSMAIALALCFGCGGSSEEGSTPRADESTAKLTVASVNYPLHYFAERIGGERVQAILPVAAGVDPAFWNPTPQEILRYQSTDLILLNGAGYAKWVPKVSLPAAKLVDTSASFADRFIHVESAVTHSHGAGEEHAHAGIAFTTWLDFEQAARQADAVYQAMRESRPEAAAEFEAHHLSLEADLEALDAEMRELGSVAKGRALLASHPVYQYLARRYALDLEAVTWEPDVSPPASAWRALERRLGERPAAIMLWEAEPLVETRQKLTDLGVRCVVFDPASQPLADQDFMERMRGNLERLREALP